jgi:hypothetical protein
MPKAVDENPTTKQTPEKECYQIHLSTARRGDRPQTGAFSILAFTESMLLSGFFLKKKPPSMLS